MSGSHSNERLEFLGDSVLSLIVSEYLFARYKDLPEGELTKTRAALVREESLCGFARSISLGEFMLFGKGERQSGGKERSSILADAFEALVAAVYLDGGIEQVRRFVTGFVEAVSVTAGDVTDFKTVLQEMAQKNERRVSYVLVSEEGPDHSKTFTTQVLIDGVQMGTGTGRNKKTSEQTAAKQALDALGPEHE